MRQIDKYHLQTFVLESTGEKHSHIHSQLTVLLKRPFQKWIELARKIWEKTKGLWQECHWNWFFPEIAGSQTERIVNNISPILKWIIHRYLAMSMWIMKPKIMVIITNIIWKSVFFCVYQQCFEFSNRTYWMFPSAECHGNATKRRKHITLHFSHSISIQQKLVSFQQGNPHEKINRILIIFKITNILYIFKQSSKCERKVCLRACLVSKDVHLMDEKKNKGSK